MAFFSAQQMLHTMQGGSSEAWRQDVDKILASSNNSRRSSDPNNTMGTLAADNQAQLSLLLQQRQNQMDPQALLRLQQGNPSIFQHITHPSHDRLAISYFSDKGNYSSSKSVSLSWDKLNASRLEQRHFFSIQIGKIQFALQSVVTKITLQKA